MRIIAFKQVKNTKIKGHLPDDFIIEWTYADLHENLSPDEWEVMLEDEFMDLLSQKNNEQTVANWKENKDRERNESYMNDSVPDITRHGT